MVFFRLITKRKSSARGNFCVCVQASLLPGLQKKICQIFIKLKVHACYWKMLQFFFFFTDLLLNIPVQSLFTLPVLEKLLYKWKMRWPLQLTVMYILLWRKLLMGCWIYKKFGFVGDIKRAVFRITCYEKFESAKRYLKLYLQ